jgi:hypothetical protein
MASLSDKAASVTQSIHPRGFFPFTGPFFAIYAFFWPAQFGAWWGTIVHAFRIVAGV